jgi:hypothetical protein
MLDYRATVTGYHPILYVSDMDVPKGEELQILKFEDRNSRDPVQFGTAICLKNTQGYFLSFNSSGEVKIDKSHGYDQFDQVISKLTKWIILDAKNPKSNSVVTPFDDIVLKSAFGFYLHIKD